MTAVGSTDLKETYRRAELGLRLLLLGDGIDSPGLVKREEGRSRASTAVRQLREAFAAALDEEVSRADIAEAHVLELEKELRRIMDSNPQARRAEAYATPALLTPAESAEVLRVSVTSIYRAVRSGELRAVRLTDTKRGAIRIPMSELERLLDEAGVTRPAVHAHRA